MRAIRREPQTHETTSVYNFVDKLNYEKKSGLS